jgi:sarcosine oxidase subunit beta
VLDRNAPLLIWDDAQTLPWEPDETEALLADPETGWLTEQFPAGVHVRPEGSGESRTILMLWDYKSRWMEPAFPPPLDEFYPEIALRGLSTMLPGLKQYFGRASRPYMDGGYYVKTPDNRLLAGPLAVDGAFVLGGLSGFGIMSSCAGGELLAAHIAGNALPTYAASFSPARFDDPEYRGKVLNWDDSGEL